MAYLAPTVGSLSSPCCLQAALALRGGLHYHSQMDYLAKLLANRKRDRVIHRLRARGWTMQRIADRVKITRQRVQQVLVRDQ